jgi:hypothetical protein
MMTQDDRQDLMAEIARRAGERKAQAQSMLEKYARERDQRTASASAPVTPPVRAAGAPLVSPVLSRIERLEEAVARIEQWVERASEARPERTASTAQDDRLAKVLDTLSQLTVELQSITAPPKVRVSAAGR